MSKFRDGYRPRTVIAASAQTYHEKVLGYSPIAYWRLDETGGTAIADSSPNSLDAMASGVTLANATSPAGNPCPLFDGVNDRIAIYSAGLASAVDGDNFTVSLWAKINSLWSEGAYRTLFRLGGGTDRYFWIVKADAANTLRYDRHENLSMYVERATTETTWFHVAMTVGGGTMKAYFNGSQTGSDVGSVPSWAGPFNDAHSAIGAWGSTLYYWSGWIADVAIFDAALDAAAIADLAVV